MRTLFRKQSARPALVGSSPTASAATHASGVTEASLIPNQLVGVRLPGGVLAGETSPIIRAHGLTGRRRLCTPMIPVQLRVGPLETVPWSSGDDTRFTCGKRWFDSIRDYPPQGRQTQCGRWSGRATDRSGNPGPQVPESKDTRPRGAVGSARHPVKVEAVGSNPIGDAQCGAVRQSGRATDFRSPWMGVQVPPVLLPAGRVPHGCL